MKKIIFNILLLLLLVSFTGCKINENINNLSQSDKQQLKSDIFMTTKMATHIYLMQANLSPQEVSLIKGYIKVIIDNLILSDNINFNSTRDFISIQIPQKYRIYGFLLIDIIEKYTRNHNLHLSEDYIFIIDLIKSGTDGVFAALEEYQ